MFYNILETALETARLAALRPEREALQASTAGGAWRRQTTTLLAKFGFKRLGSGAGGIAYGHPTYPYIIKAYRADAGFDAWMRFVRTQTDNPWVPHMRGKNIRIGTTTFVRLERLQPLKPQGWAFNTAMEFRYVFELMVNRPDDYLQKLNFIAGQRRNILADRISEVESDEDLYAILTFFRQHPPQWLDLHMGNWMTRGSDELVIIDPLFARKPLRSLGQV